MVQTRVATDLGPWPDGFEPFTTHHWVTSIAFAAVALVIVWLGGRWRGTEREMMFRAGFSGAVLLSMAIMVAYWAEPVRFTWAGSLPLHMCDLLGFMVPIALLVRTRWLSTVVFFWGLGLTTQAFIQPTLVHGLRHGVYWFFWVQHTAVLAGGLYLWWVLGYRPRARDFATMTALSLIAGIVTAAINWQTGWQYFFTGPSTPGNPTIIDHLGPWPWRVGLMWILATVVMALLWAASVLASKLVPAVNRPATESGSPTAIS
ncbi:MAG: TIGR02206 family membrane protein [Planctomycetota bacterium]